MLRSYYELVSSFVQTYAVNDFITESDAALMRFTQLPVSSPTQYKETFVTKLLKCGEVQDVHVLNKILIDGLPDSARQSMQSFSSAHTWTAL